MVKKNWYLHEFVDVDIIVSEILRIICVEEALYVRAIVFDAVVQQLAGQIVLDEPLIEQHMEQFVLAG